MRSLVLFSVVAALVTVLPLSVLADVINEEPEPGLEPARRPPPPPPPPPPPAAKPAPPAPPPPMAKPAPPPPPPMAAEKAWRFELASWLWMNSLDDDATVQGTKVRLGNSVGESFSDFDTKSVAGRAEAWHGRMGAFVESGWMDGDGSDIAKFQGNHVGYDLNRIYVDFGLSYQLLQGEFPGHRKWSLEPIVGARWAQIQQRVSAGPFGPPARVSDTKDYWEPFLGTRLVTDVTDRIQVRVGGDVGGFGAGSDLTWNTLGEVGFKVAAPLWLRVGYAAESIDYKANGGGFEFNTTSHGPRFGFALTF